MSGIEMIESAAVWVARNAWVTLVPSLLIAWVCWQRWGSARVRWILVGLLLAKLVTPTLPGWSWSVPGLGDSGRVMEASKGDDETSASVFRSSAGSEESSMFASVAEPAADGVPWWTLIWATGVVGFGSLWVLEVGRVNRMIRTQRVATPAGLLRLLEEECRFMGVSDCPEVCVLRGWGQAAVHGCWRARLLLPATWLSDLGDDELRAVLRHELAHVRRKDVLWSTLGYAVAAVHWFHPLGWLALRRLRAEAELLCDEAALTGHGETERRQYGRVLIRMMETFASSPPGAVAAFARHRDDIQHRILMIAQPQRAQRWSRAAAWLILPTLSLTLLTAGEKEAPRAEDKDSKEGVREGEATQRVAPREGEREGARDGEMKKEGARDGDRLKEGQRDGDKPREGTREGDRPREGARDGEMKREGTREGDRPREGARDGEMKREGARDGDRPREGARDGEMKREGARDGDKPREGAREGDRPKEGQREGEMKKEGMREGERGVRSAVVPSKAQPMVVQLNASGEVVNSEGRVIPDAEVRERLTQLARSNPGQEIVLRGEKETRYESMTRVLNLLKGIDVKPTLGQ
jgi:beta-lactamase regulating signal transducer with metallopeptidase domain